MEDVDFAQEGDPQGLEAPLLGAHIDPCDLLSRRDEVGVLLQGTPPSGSGDCGVGAATKKVDIVQLVSPTAASSGTVVARELRPFLDEE